jgi:hypothetical protein
MMATLSDDEYQGLKKFMGLFYEWFEAKPNHPPEIHPVTVLEGFEKKSISQAKRGLVMAINDCIEVSVDWNAERVAAVDKELLKSGAPSLSMVRSKYSKQYIKVLRRGALKSLEEYYLVKGILDGGGLLPGAGEADQLSAMMASFEASLPPHAEKG